MYIYVPANKHNEYVSVPFILLIISKTAYRLPHAQVVNMQPLSRIRAQLSRDMINQVLVNQIRLA